MRYKRYRRRRSPVAGKTLLKALAAVLLLAAAVGYMYLSTLTPKVVEHTLRRADLPDKLKNVRIVYLSDIHQGRWYSRQQVERLAAQVNDLSADVIILGGDYAEDSESAVRFFDTMPPLEARNGVYAVVGDTDRSDEPGSLEKLLAAMERRNVTGLVNDVAKVDLGKVLLYIAGADDYWSGYPDVEKVASKLNADDFVIFAAHSPNLLPDLRDARDQEGSAHWYDLALFGHTHGGQIDLLGYTPFRRLRTMLGSSYRSGWFEENRAAMLVSNGVGTEYVPLRLFAQPQIHVITLKKGS